MSENSFETAKNSGIEALEKGYIHSAQVFLKQWADQKDTPESRSYLAYCQAKAKGQVDEAISICSASLKYELDNPVHYLLLGRSHLLAGNKDEAIDIFRQGLGFAKEPRIINELNRLGLRKPNVFKKLKRNHPANRIAGKLLTRFGLR